MDTFDVDIKEIKPSNNVNDKAKWDHISAMHFRETYRILKNESIKLNNRIDALDWHAREMSSFKYEQRFSRKNSKGILEKLCKFFLEKNTILFLINGQTNMDKVFGVE